MMDDKTVRSLDKEIERAIIDVLCRMGLKRLPLMPTQQTMHLMAKAARTVYEAAVENWTNGSTMPKEGEAGGARQPSSPSDSP